MSIFNQTISSHYNIVPINSICSNNNEVTSIFAFYKFLLKLTALEYPIRESTILYSL